MPTLAVKITVRVSENNRCALHKIVDSSLFLITSIKVHRSLKELWPHWRGNDWKKIVSKVFKHEKHASFELRINIIRYPLSLRFSSIYDPKKTLLEIDSTALPSQYL